MATLTTSYQLIASKYIGEVSGSGVATKSVYLRVYAKHGTQDIVNNKSPVSYKSTLYVEGSGTYFYTGATTTKSLSGTGAAATSGSAVGNYNLGETTLSEISGTVSHNSAGAASISVTAGWTSTPWGISGSVTGTATLPTIPRVTKPTFSKTSCTMNGSDSITITMNPASGTFIHKIRYAFGSLTQKAEGITPMVADFTMPGYAEAKFTPPVSLCSQIPNSMSGTCTITCYTYTAEGKLIGSYDQKVTLNVPTYTPKISSITLNGNALRDGAYVQGKSTVTVNTTFDTQNWYGATIKSYYATLDGKTYTGNPFTSSVLSSGSKTVTVNITDSRGKTAQKTSSSITVYAYAKPNITEFTLTRDENTPTTVVATVKGNIASIGEKNGQLVEVTLNGVTKPVQTSKYTINGTTTFTDVPTDSSFSGTAYLADYYTSTTKTVVLPTVDVTMDFHHSGKGVAFGKVAEKEDLLDIDWDVKIKGNPLNNFEFWQGSNIGWTFKKYVSGEIEAYRSVSNNTSVQTAYGNGYYNGAVLSINLPPDFLDNAFPVINATVQSTQAQILDVSIASYNQAERKISYYITSPAKQATTYQMWVHFRVVGRWK